MYDQTEMDFMKDPEKSVEPETVEAPETPKMERVNCQYCEDSGLCNFCERGREMVKQDEELKIKKKK